MVKLSIIILGQNVADEIVPAFKTAKFADEIIYVDTFAGSTDGTLDLARKFATKIVTSPTYNFSAWRNDGAKAATGEWLLSAAVVTTTANAVVGRLHDRMPAILEPEAWRLWADPQLRDAGLLSDMLRPADEALLTVQQVSPLVNNVDNEGPALLTPPEPTAGDSGPLTLFG